jgi:hypothetical protein
LELPAEPGPFPGLDGDAVERREREVVEMLQRHAERSIVVLVAFVQTVSGVNVINFLIFGTTYIPMFILIII